jgi:hypothetical protein
MLQIKNVWLQFNADLPDIKRMNSQILAAVDAGRYYLNLPLSQLSASGSEFENTQQGTIAQKPAGIDQLSN